MERDLQASAGRYAETSTLTSGKSNLSYSMTNWLPLTLLRVCLGLDMLTHGIPKLLNTPHGTMTDPINALTNVIGNVLHFPVPGFFALLITILESFGAVSLVLGFATRPIAAIMFVELLFASYVHAPVWPWVDRGMEMAMMLAAISVYVAFRGGGPLSVDGRLNWRNSLFSPTGNWR